MGCLVFPTCFGPIMPQQVCDFEALWSLWCLLNESLNINEQSDTKLTLVQQTKVIFLFFISDIFLVVSSLSSIGWGDQPAFAMRVLPSKKHTENDSKPTGVASPFHQPTHTCQASNSVQSWEHKINRSNYSTAQSRCLREPTSWLWVITETLMRYRSIGMWVCCGD